MRLLVLGGGTFVGRTIVTTALDRGWDVTTFTRGTAPWRHPAAHHHTGDRHNPTDLATLTHNHWDAVVDTWSAAPSTVRTSADTLSGYADRYLYVSSRAVYAFPTPHGLTEDAPTVDASPDAPDTEYGRNKRGAEIAVTDAFGDRAVLARAGLILGPHEDPARLPIWLERLHRGGRVLAPGPAGQPWQYIDVRDLTTWLLDAAMPGSPVTGPVNLVCPAGHATTDDVLTTARDVTRSTADILWTSPEEIAASGVNRWTEFPGWVPPDDAYAGLHTTDVSRALATGLRIRPLAATVRDTWDWMRSLPR